MVNEGIVVNDTRSLLKSAILKQVWRLGPTSSDALERAVFRTLTGGEREDVDWDVEDNQAGYFLWIKGFDLMLAELEEEGYLRAEKSEDGRFARLLPVEALPALDVPHLVYPPAR
jgi:hypothetical protein